MNLEKPFEMQLNTLGDTRRLARILASALKPPCTIALEGTLGAGKTQMVRFFAQSLGAAAESVTSPTYVLMQIYPTKPTMYHIDAYRLKNIEEFWDLGVEELFDQQVFVLIEWASRVAEGLPENYLKIDLEPTGTQTRHCRLTWHGANRPPEWCDIIELWQESTPD